MRIPRWSSAGGLPRTLNLQPSRKPLFARDSSEVKIHLGCDVTRIRVEKVHGTGRRNTPIKEDFDDGERLAEIGAVPCIGRFGDSCKMRRLKYPTATPRLSPSRTTNIPDPGKALEIKTLQPWDKFNDIGKNCSRHTWAAFRRQSSKKSS